MAMISFHVLFLHHLRIKKKKKVNFLGDNQHERGQSRNGKTRSASQARNCVITHRVAQRRLEGEKKREKKTSHDENLILLGDSLLLERQVSKIGRINMKKEKKIQLPVLPIVLRHSYSV